MNNYYKDNHFDELFCYFFKIYSHIHQDFQNIPRLVPQNSDNEWIANFINKSVSILEKSYNKELFNLVIQSLYAVKLKDIKDDIQREKLIFSNMVINLIFEKDFITFLDTSSLWSEETGEYMLFGICPKLPVNWRKSYLTLMGIL